MAIIAASGLIAEWYTPEDEVDEDKPTRFKLKPLSQLELLEVMSEGRANEDGDFVTNHKGRMILLRKGISDWEEFYDNENNPIKFSFTNFSRVPVQVLGELSNEIMARSILTDEEKKS